MAKITGWDTEGVTEVGALRDGRMKLSFKGKDGDTKNILIPRESLSQLIPNLLAMNAAMANAESAKDSLSGTHMTGISQAKIAADEHGKQFGLVLVTNDKLELSFLLDRHTTESLATGLAATLAKYGIHIQLDPPAGSKH